MKKFLYSSAITFLLLIGNPTAGFSKDATPAEIDNLLDTVARLMVSARNCGMPMAEGTKFDVLFLLMGHGYESIALESEIDRYLKMRGDIFGTICDEKAVATYAKEYAMFYGMMEKTLSEGHSLAPQSQGQ